MMQSHDASATLWPHQIETPYLMVLNLALTRHDGRYWAHPLWAKDILLHLKYIQNLSLFCPIKEERPPQDWLPIENVQILPAGPPGRRLYLRIPVLTVKLWHAIGRTAVVHVGLGGWPFPMGWIAVPIARLRQRKLLTIIESSFWRASPSASILKKIKAALFERLNRICVNRCDLALFTSKEYRDSLATAPRGATCIAPATWVDAGQLLSLKAVREKWRRKEPRFLFAGRLTAEKGVTDLLEAVKNISCQIDIIGDGGMLEECQSAVAAFPDRIRLLQPVPYGDAFSALLDDYAAIILPTRSDEQPRILFDAFARGIPAIASSTAANEEILSQSNAGISFERANAIDLAATIERASADLTALRKLGLRARDYASNRTHAAMHQHRAMLIVNMLGDGDTLGSKLPRSPVKLISRSAAVRLPWQRRPAPNAAAEF